MDVKAESDAKSKGKRLDLSVAQVAGSALAAVVAALLAGKLGVYGTVIGAGVVSVVATTGGTVFQHLFRRTGEQVRDVAVQAGRPRMRQVPLDEAGRAVGRARGRDDATRMLPEVHAGAYPGAYDDVNPGPVPPGFTEEYSEGTTHGTRLRGWKRPLLAAGAVFVLAMGTVTAVELVSGQSADGKKDGTTILRPFQGGGGKSEKKEKEHGSVPDSGTSRTPGSGSVTGGGGEDDGKGGASSSPDTSQSTGGGSGSPSPDAGGSSSGGSSPSPEKSPDASGSPDAGTGGSSGGKTSGGTGDGGKTPPPVTQAPPVNGAGGASSAP